ncbi:MAG: hypothetical protein AAFW95_07510, partial [Cyanobacteria bacterium J06638_6]
FKVLMGAVKAGNTRRQMRDHRLDWLHSYLSSLILSWLNGHRRKVYYGCGRLLRALAMAIK